MFVVLGHKLAAQMDLAVCPQDHNAGAENSNTYEHLKSVAAPCALAPECGASCRVLDQPRRSRANFAPELQKATRTEDLRQTWCRTQPEPQKKSGLHRPRYTNYTKADRIANGRENRPTNPGRNPAPIPLSTPKLHHIARIGDSEYYATSADPRQKRRAAESGRSRRSTPEQPSHA